MAPTSSRTAGRYARRLGFAPEVTFREMLRNPTPQLRRYLPAGASVADVAKVVDLIRAGNSRLLSAMRERAITSRVPRRSERLAARPVAPSPPPAAVSAGRLRPAPRAARRRARTNRITNAALNDAAEALIRSNAERRERQRDQREKRNARRRRWIPPPRSVLHTSIVIERKYVNKKGEPANFPIHLTVKINTYDVNLGERYPSAAQLREAIGELEDRVFELDSVVYKAMVGQMFKGVDSPFSYIPDAVGEAISFILDRINDFATSQYDGQQERWWFDSRVRHIVAESISAAELQQRGEVDIQREGMHSASVLRDSFMRHLEGIESTAFESREDGCVAYQLHGILTRPQYSTPITSIPVEYMSPTLVDLTLDSMKAYLSTLPNPPSDGGVSPMQIGLMCSDLRLNMFALDVNSHVFLRITEFDGQPSRVHREVWFRNERISHSRHHPIVFISANKHMYVISDEHTISSITRSCSEKRDFIGARGDGGYDRELEVHDTEGMSISELLDSPRSGTFVVDGKDCLLNDIREHFLPRDEAPIVKVQDGRVVSCTVKIISNSGRRPELPKKPVRSDFDKHHGGPAYKSAMMVYERDMFLWINGKQHSSKMRRVESTMTFVTNPFHRECIPVAVVKAICAAAHIRYCMQGPGRLALDLAHAAQRRRFTLDFVKRILQRQEKEYEDEDGKMVRSPLCCACKKRIHRGQASDPDSLPCEIDHITPVAAGGTNDIDNLQALCLSCHANKTMTQLSNVSTADYESSLTLSVVEHVLPNAKVWAFTQNLTSSSGTPDDALQYDFNRMYYHVLRDGNGCGWPVFSVMDLVEAFDGTLRDASVYYVETGNSLPLHGCGYYDSVIVRYCLDEGIIALRDIKWQYVPNKVLKADHFVPYQDRITESIAGIEGIIDELVAGSEHAVSGARAEKFLQNSFIGVMANTDCTAEWMRMTKSLAQAHTWHVSDGAIDRFVSTPFPEHPDLFVGTFSSSIAMMTTACFIRTAVISRANVLLHRLMKHVMSIGGTPLWVKTDCLGYIGAPELNLDDWRWPDGSQMLKKESPCAPLYESQRGLAREPTVFPMREWSVDTSYDGDASAAAEKFIAMRTGMLLVGRPGTGKSFLLSTIIEELERRNVKYTALSTTHVSKNQIGHWGVEGHDDSPLHDPNSNESANTVDHLLRLWKNNSISTLRILMKSDYLIVDEISMMREQIYALLVIIKKRLPGLKMILVGDFMQLKPVKDIYNGTYEDSGALLDLCDATCWHLQKCLRENEGEVFSMLDDVHAGLEIDVAKHFPVTRTTMMNLAYTHATRKRVNEKCMKIAAEGKCVLEIKAPPELPKAQDVMLVVGSPCICVKTVKASGLYNGEMHRVLEWSAQRVVLGNALRGDDEPIEVVIDDFHRLFRIAHCITVHQSQGATIREPYTIYDWFHPRMIADTSARYVALSRCVRKSDVQIAFTGVVACVEPINEPRIHELLALIKENKNALTPEQSVRIATRRDFLEKMLTRPKSVHYSRRGGIGRLYASDHLDEHNRGRSLQGCPADLRAALVGHVGHDIDVVNSLPALTVQWLASLGIDESHYANLKDYVDHREQRLSDVAEWHSISRGEAKALFLITIFGGDPVPPTVNGFSRNLFPMLKRLGVEIKALHHEVVQMRIELPQYREVYEARLGRSKGDVQAAERSTFSLMTHEVEDIVMGHVRDFLGQRRVAVYALTFDGVIASACSEELLRGAEEYVAERGFAIELVEKPLHGLQDEVPESLRCLSSPDKIDARTAWRGILKIASSDPVRAV